MASVELRLTGGALMPINLDYQQQLASFLNARLPSEDLLFSRWQPRPPVNPLTCDNAPEILTPPYPPLPPIAINELQWPSGASRYGRALYLIDGATLRAVAMSCFGWVDPDPPDPGDPPVDNIAVEIPALWGPKQYPLEVAIFGEELFRASMFALPPYRVPGAGMGLFLLPLVDRRFYDLCGVHAPTEDQPESIQSLIDDLAGEIAFGLNIAKDAIASEYGTKADARLYDTSVPQPASNLLDIAALSIGQRVVLEPSTGGYRMLNADNSSQRRDRRLGLTVSVEDGTTTATGETSAMLVAGGKRGRAALPPRLSVWVTKDGQPHERISDNFPDGASVGGRNYPVWTSWIETNSNESETDEFVAQVVKDLSDWSNSGGQYCLAGAINYQPCGFDDYLSVQFLEVPGENGEWEPVLRSRVYELPSLFVPSVILVGGDNQECGGGGIRYFVLAEDANSCPVWAFEAEMSDVGLVTAKTPTVLFELYFHSELLSYPKVAKAGYTGIYSTDDQGRKTFLANPCITGCQPAGSLDAGALPDGEVGVAYSSAVSASDVDTADITASGLPPGLSYNSTTGYVEGTPTTAGTFRITLSGSDANGCAITDIDEMVIAPATGPGPETPPESP